MTAPKVHSLDTSSLVWEDSPPTKSNICKANCHAANPAKDSASLFSRPNSPWFLDAQAPKGSLAYFNAPLGDAKAIEAWLQADGAFAVTANSSSPPENPVPKIDPAQAKPFMLAGQENERLAAKAATAATRLAYLENALSSYQLAGEIVACKKILGLMRKEFRQLDHPTGVLKVEAELAFLDGDVAKAAENFRIIELSLSQASLKLPLPEKEAALLEVNLKLSLALQALGDKAVHEKKWDAALGHYEEALRRTPSPLLSEKILALLLKSGKGDIEALRKKSGETVYSLAKQALQLRNHNPCNTNCHSSVRGPSDLEIISYADTLEPSSSLLTGFQQKPLTTEPPQLVFSAWKYDSLKLLSHEQKIALFDTEQKLVEAKWQGEKQVSDLKAYLRWVVSAGYGGAQEFDAEILLQKRLAKAFVDAGDTAEGLKIYGKIVKDIEAQALISPDKAGHLTFLKVEARHEWASLELQLGAKHHSPMSFETAQKILATAELELSGLKTEGVEQGSLKETLRIQNQFLRAECLLSLAKTEEDLEAGQKILGALVCESSGSIQTLKSDDPRKAILGRVRLRLAELYYSRTDHAPQGDNLVARILESFGDDPYVSSQALLIQGSYKLEHGQAQRALEIFRNIQDKYPQSEAALGLGQSGLLGKFRDARGKIRTDMNADDLGEALKVALEKSGSTPSARKWGLAGVGAGIGFVIALVLAPEITIPVLIGGGLTGASIGAGGGLLVNRAWGIVDHWGEVKDAYRTGYSNVDMGRNIQNMFLLGLDLAMLIPAGAVGKVVESGTRSAMSYSLKWAAGQGLRFAGNRTVAMIATRGIPVVANYLAAYTFLKGEQSLFYGKNFEWNPAEAMLMVMMCSNFAMAHKMGLGSRIATAGKFPGGKLLPVIHEGELIGFTTATGKAIGWATDITLGASVHYGMVLGLDKKYGLKNHIPGFQLSGYGDFLEEQMWSLGALHLGSKWAGKLSHQALDNALLKLDKKSQAWLNEAQELAKQDSGGSGPFGPWGPQFAYAGVGATPPTRPFRFETPSPKVPTGMMMATDKNGPRIEVMESELSHGFGKNQGKNQEKNLTVEVWLENSKNEKLIEQLKERAKQSGLRFELKDIQTGGIIVIEAKPGGKIEATTTDIEMVKRSPQSVTLVLEAADPYLLGPRLQKLSEQGIKRVKIRLSEDQMLGENIAECARTAVETGLDLELLTKNGQHLTRVSQESGGAKVQVNRVDLETGDAVIRQAVEKLARSALQAKVQHLQIGKQITLSRSAKTGGPEYSFSTSLQIYHGKGIFAEYLAHETLRGAGMKPDQIQELKTFWQGAMEHAIDMEANINMKKPQGAAKRAELAPYVDGNWAQSWQNSLRGMLRFASTTSHQGQIRKTLELLNRFSQPNPDHLLGFKPFAGRALADNAFELMRLFEASDTLPQLRPDLVLERIATVLGEHGNVRLYGAVVGTLFRAGIPRIENGKVVEDPYGNPKLDTAAQNEYRRLVEQKNELMRRQGNYRLTVVPEDRLQGANFRTPDYTRTPDWILETLDAQGRTQRVETIEVTQAHGSKMTEDAVRNTLREKIDQSLEHQFAQHAPSEGIIIAYKFYNPGGNETNLLEWATRATAAETAARPSIDIKGKLRVVVLFESSTHGGSAPRKYLIEFKNGTWRYTPTLEYFPQNVYPFAKTASGWK